MPSFTTGPDSHFHGIDPDVLEWVLDACENPGEDTRYLVGDLYAAFAIVTVSLPDSTRVACDLRGPIVGDPPITDAWDENRPGVAARTWTSRITDLKPTQTDKVTVIAHAGGVITVFGGPLSPQEPGDPGCQDLDASKAFWAEHALSSESLTREVS